MQRVHPRFLAAALLVVMALLMIGSSRQDSATVDETTHIATGFGYWHGAHAAMMADDHPILGRMVVAAPLLLMDAKYSDLTAAMVRGELGYPWTPSWDGSIHSVQGLLPQGCDGRQVQLPPLGDGMIQWRCPSSYLVDNWYYWAVPESQMLGKYFFYDGTNNGDAMLFAGRLMQIAVTLLIGVVIFIWARRATGNDWPALLALALWVLNPLALAYGHLTNTDIGVTLGMTFALYRFARLVESPTLKHAAFAGVATGIALCFKFTSLILAPIFVALMLVNWKRVKMPWASFGKITGVFFLAGWATILIVYFPHWALAPPLTESEAAALKIPGWFQALRPLLIPAGFFKGIALALGYSGAGKEGYLCGDWLPGGWWYYFPVAFVLKSPVAFVLLVTGSLGAFLKHRKSAPVLEHATWLGAAVYLASAMTSHINIGARHLLPMIPLFCIGIGCAGARLKDRRIKIAGGVLLGWQTISVLLAYPLYLQFFSEAVGGARNGYQYLVDSNFDWGQDANRLKRFLDDHRIAHIYLDYFGTQLSIEHLKIPNTRVNAETAKQIRQGTLVVSASQLMRPEWAWLRQSRSPADRVAYTLFVYQFP